MAESKEETDRWPFPQAFCPTCGRGCCMREELIIHCFERQHWSRLPAVDRAGAATLLQAVQTAEARRQPKEVRDDPRAL